MKVVETQPLGRMTFRVFFEACGDTTFARYEGCGDTTFGRLGSLGRHKLRRLTFRLFFEACGDTTSAPDLPRILS